MKKACVLSLMLTLSLISLGAQQLTRFAVVDMGRIYSAFPSDTRAAREWEERTARVQQEVDKRTAEIQELKSRHAEAVLANNESEARKLIAELERRSLALKAYYEGETKKLEDQRARLPQNSAFLENIYNAVRVAAESEGYSMVLNLRENKGIVWYSQAIDITDKVIAYLRARTPR
ncbi:MAG: OmpH family outer membrane protein [Spirochaetaceae bacterium]|jgi:outer membrane protein|nr:OmpH family outer membrane protein [Spirochaetaceae bacterium]